MVSDTRATAFSTVTKSTTLTVTITITKTVEAPVKAEWASGEGVEGPLRALMNGSNMSFQAIERFNHLVKVDSHKFRWIFEGKLDIFG